jgi:hypothetical protein
MKVLSHLSSRGIKAVFLLIPCLVIFIVFSGSSCLHSAKPARQGKYPDTLKIKPCGFVHLPDYYFPDNLKNPDSNMIKVVENVLDATGMHLNIDNKNFYLAEADGFKNALAIPEPIIDQYQCLFIHRYIIYDAAFINKLLATCSPAAAYVIFSHEISHHLNGDSFMDSDASTDRRQRELAADSFAGFLCYKLSLSQHFSLADCVKVYETIGDSLDTDTHPNKKLREQTFTNGWNTSKEYLTLSCDAANQLQQNPVAAINEISATSPAFVQTVTQQSVQAIAKVPGKVDFAKKTANMKFADEVINLRGDSSLFVEDKNNKILPVQVKAPALGTYLISPQRLDISKSNSLSNQYIRGKGNEIWARYPNGLYYVAGYVQTLK